MLSKFRLASITLLLLSITAASVNAQQRKPNIVVIMADDVGVWNLSAYHRGMMGGRTPNIDRIANEGALFTDYYAQQSCTAGRAAFITGQTPFRTGLLKVGMPAAKQGLQDKDPTIAELLNPSAMPRRRSVRTIRATAMNTCRRYTHSLPSQRDGGALPRRLSEDCGVPPTLRPAQHRGYQSHQHGRHDHRSALG